MLAAAANAREITEGIDLAAIIGGAACVVGFVVWLVRRAEWRNPLAGVRAAALWRVAPVPPPGFPAEPNPEAGAGADQPGEFDRAAPTRSPAARLILGPEGPTLLHIVLALAVYLVLVQLATATLLVGRDLQAATQPNTPTWYIFQAADGLARLLASLFAISILVRHPLFPPGRTGAAVARKVGVGALTGLGLMAITIVQLQMGSIVWQWLHPSEMLPIHPVLLALKEGRPESWQLAILLISAIVVAPLSEELLFRGLVLGATWRLTGRAWVAVVISGITFGAIHAQPQDILPLCTMGVILGYVRLRAGSLVPTIIAHALFNGRTMVAALLFPEAIGG